MDLAELRKINTIIERDRTDATYKYALLRAVIDVCQIDAHWGDGDGDRIWFPMGLLIERWIFSYYPLLASTPFIPQKRGEPHGKHAIAFRPEFERLIDAYRDQGGYQVFSHQYRTSTLPDDVKPDLFACIHSIRKTIADMPMKFLGYSYNQDYYSIFTPDRPLPRMPTEVAGDREALIRSAGRFSMSRDLFEVFSHLGGFIIGEESVLQKWAAFSADADRSNAITASQVLDILQTTPENQRATTDARRIYSDLIHSGDGLRCVWTGDPIRSDRQLEVDHILPFSIWRNNDLWNLMPSTNAANRQKRDLIPSIDLLVSHQYLILGYWEILRSAFPMRFEQEATIALLGEDSFDTQAAFLSLQEKCRYLTDIRGYGLWEGKDD